MDGAEPVGPVAAVTTRSWRAIHPRIALSRILYGHKFEAFSGHGWVINFITQDFAKLRDEVPPRGGNV